MNYTYSITITHYNSPSLLERMLKSIPERDDIQVIVVDDASCEEAKDTIAQLRHKNLQVIYTPENHGAGYERNVGLDHAQGKWLIACDCDDIFAEGAFDALDEYKDSDYDYICYCVKSLDPSTLEPIKKHLRSDESVRKYLKNKNLKSLKYFKFYNSDPWNKMVNTQFMKNNDIHWEDCRINVDVLFSYLLALKSKNYYAIPNELYLTIGDSNSITRKKRTIEREFGFYLAQQKRNGFFKRLKFGYPFYRYDILYLPFLLLKHGLKGTIDFYKYKKTHSADIRNARELYIKYLNGVNIRQVLNY